MEKKAGVGSDAGVDTARGAHPPPGHSQKQGAGDAEEALGGGEEDEHGGDGPEPEQDGGSSAFDGQEEQQHRVDKGERDEHQTDEEVADVEHVDGAEQRSKKDGGRRQGAPLKHPKDEV